MCLHNAPYLMYFWDLPNLAIHFYVFLVVAQTVQRHTVFSYIRTWLVNVTIHTGTSRSLQFLIFKKTVQSAKHNCNVHTQRTKRHRVVSELHVWGTCLHSYYTWLYMYILYTNPFAAGALHVQLHMDDVILLIRLIVDDVMTLLYRIQIIT